ncbi:MAG: hypothetical protein GX781_06755 [Clostridiales bacterium]|nr:hypothetical protein [Clostridiales bacterium]
MNKKMDAYKVLIPSLLVTLVGLVLSLLQIGMKFQAGAGDMVSLNALFVSIVAVAVTSFIFAAVRYNAATGLVLGIVTLHDQVLTLAIVAILSMILPQANIMPIMVIFSVAFTFAQSLPVIREIRDLRHSNSIRDMSNEMVVDKAVKSTDGLRIASTVLAGLFIIAGLFSGNIKFVYALSPLVVGLLVSLYSARTLTSKLWLDYSPRMNKRK